jgi:hypothetical protein
MGARANDLLRLLGSAGEVGSGASVTFRVLVFFRQV